MLIEPARTFRAPLRQRRGPAERMRAALSDLAQGQAEIVSHSQQAWASITFSGARHRVELAFEGEEAVAAGERFLDQLPDHEFAVPGHLVADAAVVCVDHRLMPCPRMGVIVELLILEDG